MNKFHWLTAILLVIGKLATAQMTSASAIKHANYLNDPKLYTSKIDTNKIKSKILIDRSFYNSILLNVNGTSKVTSITGANWSDIYESLIESNSDTTFFPSPNNLEALGIEMKKNSNVYPLTLLNIDFKRVKESAIINGEFSEQIDFLKDIKANTNSFETIKAFAGTSIFSSIFGDDVYFSLPSKFMFNNTKEVYNKIEIDFGNGLGFQTVNNDDIILVHYPNSNNEFIEIKIKATVSIGNASPKTLYTHFTLFRKSSSTIKMPTSNKPKIVGDYNIFEYYPKNSNDYRIEYNYLLNASNKSGKLRRPFIVCDGFDYGDRRNYFEKITTFNEKYDAPEDNNTYGLYEVLNGTPTLWSKGEKHPNFIDSLLKYGYDLIFVNFKEGTGDIFKNAASFRGFMNTVINKELRDSLTEESVVVGPSMGGIITRMALTQMEKAGEEHFVKIWISFDSPQKGANIPIALQHNIVFGTSFFYIGDIFTAKKKALDSKASMQLLKHHYSMSDGVSHPTKDYIQMFNYLDTLGYPKLSKNYGITNGGRTILYTDAGIQITQFSLNKKNTLLFGWSQHNSPGTFQLAHNDRQLGSPQIVKSESQLPLDNAPGGWHDGVNSLNFSPKNNEIKNLNKESVNNKWACFIPTSSAMGCDVNGNTIYSTWENFTTCNDNTSSKMKTPFDEIHGMETNEEHTKISAQTGEYVIDEFQEYMTSTVRPIVRVGKPINQTIKGKVAYLVIDTIQFGNTGNGNTYTLTNTADINIRAGKSIRFHQGFKAVAGSKMSAKIVAISATPYSSTAGSYKSAYVENANSFDPSPYVGKVYDYSENEITPLVIKDDITLNVFPNPTERIVNIAVDGLNGNQSTLEIYDALGNTVFSQSISNNGTYQLDSSFLQSGVYFIKVKSNNSEAYQRLVKL